MFLDLQLRWRGIWRLSPFMTRSLFSFTRGHWRQPRLLQCWSSDVILGKLSCLLRTTLFPIELFFFKANIMRVSPINCLSSLSRLRTSDLNSERPLKKWTGKANESTSYVTYQDKCYKSKVGIPTGGSLSRQIADIFLHWIMFIKMTPNLSLIQAIRFWKRFIDDIIGVWQGTKRSFINFVTQLNAETMKYGIKFPINQIVWSIG